MAQNSTDAAAEAIKYGKLAFMNENLKKDNNVLVVENDELEKKLAKNKELLQKEEAALQELSQKANDMRREEKELEAKKTRTFDEREKNLKVREADLAKNDKDLTVRENDVALREDNVSAREAGVSTRTIDIDTKETDIRTREDRLRSREVRLVEANEKLLSDIEEADAQKKEALRILNESKKETERLELAKVATRAEVEKLQDHTAKMRIENETNRKIKQQMELSIPRMQNMVLVLREFQEFISAHMKNPDAIDNKFAEIAEKLDIAILPPKK